MLITELINKYQVNGFNFKDAQNLAAEEIILKKIGNSSLVDNITLKGGILMYRITRNERRVTKDIDFDFIRYSIDEVSIQSFIQKLNSFNDQIQCQIIGKIQKLHQENYSGVRVNLVLRDIENKKLRIKLDIGVHVYTAIEQEKLLFSFDNAKNGIFLKVNSCEQMFAEKFLSLGRLGPISTRYKDIYDMYYLIKNNLVEKDKVIACLQLFLASNNKNPNTIEELVERVNKSLDDNEFSKEASKQAVKWIDVDYDSVKRTLNEFLN